MSATGLISLSFADLCFAGIHEGISVLSIPSLARSSRLFLSDDFLFFSSDLPSEF